MTRRASCPRSADRDHRDRVLAPRRRQRRAVDRVDGDVARRSAPVADVLAVEQHRRLVLLALADDDDAVEVDGAEELAHGIDRRAVGAVLVALADERHGADGGGLGGPHQLHARGCGRGGGTGFRFRWSAIVSIQIVGTNAEVRRPAEPARQPTEGWQPHRPPIRRPAMPIATPDQYAEMLDKAKKRGFAYPAINVSSSSTINAVLQGLTEAGSDGIIQVTTGGADYFAGQTRQGPRIRRARLRRVRDRGRQELPHHGRAAHRPLPEGRARRLRLPAHRRVRGRGQGGPQPDLPVAHVGRLGRAARGEPRDRAKTCCRA